MAILAERGLLALLALAVALLLQGCGGSGSETTTVTTTTTTTTTKVCCPPKLPDGTDFCSQGSMSGLYAITCMEQGYKCNPRDRGCNGSFGDYADASCTPYETQCPARCCQRDCCGTEREDYRFGHLDVGCCDNAQRCWTEGCDSRCQPNNTGIECKSKIKWNAHPTFVFDVNSSVDSGDIHFRPPVQVWLWEGSDGKHLEDPFFVWDNSAPYGLENNNRGWICWGFALDGCNQCLEATSPVKGATLNVNTCVESSDHKYNPMQQWNLVSTAYGSKIQLKNTNMCVNVHNYQAKNATPLELWECINDSMQSFEVLQNPNNLGETAISV